MRTATVTAALTTLLGVAAYASTARAHSAGQPSPGCVGCHGQGDYDVTVASSSTWAPGAQMSITVTIAPGFGDNAGIFVGVKTGTLGVVDGQGLAIVSNGLTHTAPKPLTGGQASFTFSFTAPDEPGAVRFDVSTLVGNGNGGSGGDQGTRKYFDFVYGCTPATYYVDTDGDGYGQDNLPLVHCDTAIPLGYAALGGDCDDYKEGVHPDAVEYCNQVDDDCDGEIDDDPLQLTLYPDADGDGYWGSAEYTSGETIVGCVPTRGWAAEGIDCQPDDPAVNPGAEEVCNLVDDNCDSREDEFVRPRCGVGWCEREAFNCDPSSCAPGEPRPEECNLLDDDCDGFVDNGTLCPTGQSCVAAQCIEDSRPPAVEEGSTGCAVGGRHDTTWLGGLAAALTAWLGRRTRARGRSGPPVRTSTISD